MMEVRHDTDADLTTTVTDVRRTPLVRLAQHSAGAETIGRVLADRVAARATPATFNSAI